MIIKNSGIYICEVCGNETTAIVEFCYELWVCAECLKAALDALDEANDTD